ncbi:MAG: type II toxin-antitoxin system RelE/ParE family toxin [Oscillospiraceae bacterium]|nr:type II toxin-antitoxin system RelE/ParE family toxin [Oscillospiraceae bacterium]MBQ9045851.1 type II toxin-antitoxin system RelE/ParE family toxin [Oscillospiraceae bacterium]
MDHYKIIITPDAENDLAELINYISDVLLARDTARSYIRTIREAISILNEMPARYKAVDNEPWHSRGIRRIIAKNFYVYYRIDEEHRRVFILNIIYARRDQLRALEQMNSN